MFLSHARRASLGGVLLAAVTAASALAAQSDGGLTSTVIQPPVTTPSQIGFSLSPATASRTVGDSHTVTASNATAGGPVDFTVMSGRSADVTSRVISDDTGHATFTYRSTLAGTDSIHAFDVRAEKTAAPVQVTWLAPPAVSVGDVSVAEGNSGDTLAVFTVSLSRAPLPNQTVHVTATTANGSAAAGTDYAATSSDLTFAAGEASKQVSVPVHGDKILEPDETFTLALDDLRGVATLADGSATGTILNDERVGQFTCRASALRVSLLLKVVEPFVANPASAQCVNWSTGRGFVPLTTPILIGATVFAAATGVTDTDHAPAEGDGASAFSYIKDVAIKAPGALIEARSLESAVVLACGKPNGPHSRAHVVESRSAIVGLKVNGRPVAVDGGRPVTIPLGIATLRLNATVGLTRRGLWLSTPLGEVVAGESSVGTLGGDPCATA